MIFLLAVTLTFPASWLIAGVTLLAAIAIYFWLSAKDGDFSGYGLPAYGCAGGVVILIVLLFWAGWFARGWLA